MALSKAQTKFTHTLINISPLNVPDFCENGNIAILNNVEKIIKIPVDPDLAQI